MVETKACHDGAKEAFKIGKVSVWGCAGHSVRLVPDPLLAQISCSFNITEDEVQVNAQARSLFTRSIAAYQLAPTLPCMHIDWRDREAPPVAFDFWQAMVQDLLTQQTAANLVVNCVGGHGRTGTALICLAHVAGVIPTGKDAILWLREIYCEEAVESAAQIDYIKENGIFTEVVYVPPVYNNITWKGSENAWVACTTCKFYASPAAVRDCKEAKLPIRCDTCTNTTRSSAYAYDRGRWCQVCNFSLSPTEEAESIKIGVDICKDCDKKFGHDSLIEDKKEHAAMETIMDGDYKLPGDDWGRY